MRHRSFKGRTTSQLPPSWYPVELQLCYETTSKMGPRYGFGQTTMILVKKRLAPGDALEPGREAEFAHVWPLLLDDRIRLQLVFPGDDHR